jgi:hypothetical protein
MIAFEITFNEELIGRVGIDNKHLLLINLKQTNSIREMELSVLGKELNFEYEDTQEGTLKLAQMILKDGLLNFLTEKINAPAKIEIKVIETDDFKSISSPQKVAFDPNRLNTPPFNFFFSS